MLTVSAAQVDSLQQKLMATVDGILAVHEFHIWQLAGDRIIASAHIRCLNLAQYMEVRIWINKRYYFLGPWIEILGPQKIFNKVVIVI